MTSSMVRLTAFAAAILLLGGCRSIGRMFGGDEPPPEPPPEVKPKPKISQAQAGLILLPFDIGSGTSQPQQAPPPPRPARTARTRAGRRLHRSRCAPASGSST